MRCGVYGVLMNEQRKRLDRMSCKHERPDRSILQRRCDTVIVTGGETDMCVLSTVLGAADYGLRTIVVQDAVCSASIKPMMT